MHAQLVVDHGHRVAPHLAGAAGVEHGRAGLPRIVEQFVVALHIGAGQPLGRDVPRERRRREQPPDQPQSPDDGTAIGLLAQIARVDRRRLSRVL